jgi:hypothetical protein
VSFAVASGAELMAFAALASPSDTSGDLVCCGLGLGDGVWANVPELVIKTNKNTEMTRIEIKSWDFIFSP